MLACGGSEHADLVRRVDRDAVRCDVVGRDLLTGCYGYDRSGHESSPVSVSLARAYPPQLVAARPEGSQTTAAAGAGRFVHLRLRARKSATAIEGGGIVTMHRMPRVGINRVLDVLTSPHGANIRLSFWTRCPFNSNTGIELPVARSGDWPDPRFEHKYQCVQESVG